MLENKGWITIHRKLKDSDIWEKPPEWLKIWIYLLLNVSYEDKKYPRGTYYFRYEWIAKDCNVTYPQVRHCIDWLKKASQIVTRKVTHGIVISVLNYAKYQDDKVLESQTESQTIVKQKSNTSHNISNKETIKQSNNVIDSEQSSQIKSIMDIFYKTNPTLNWANKTYRKSIEEMIKLWGVEKTTRMAEFAVSVQGQPFSPTITNPYHLKLKATELGIYWKRKDKENKSTLTIAE